MKLNYVGKPVLRLDAKEKVTGQAVYSVDIDLPGMLHGAVLRSPFAHAEIIDIDGSAARSVAGVRAVVTGKDFPYTFGPMIKDQPFLACGKVRYVGEPVAAVAADTESAAQEAIEKIKVNYRELAAVFDPQEAARKTAPLIHEDLENYSRSPVFTIVPGTNICTSSSYRLGNPDKGFVEADAVFEDEFYVHAVAHTPMETHAAVAQYQSAKGVYVIWSATDGPYRRCKELAQALGIPLNKVRFISTYSGGGFGGKGALVAESLAVVLARFTDGRPVRVHFLREEELTASQTRIAALIKLKTGVKKEGTLIARRAEIFWDNGAYASKAPEVSVRGALSIFGPYRIPNLEIISKLVYTNKEISGAYRGYGTPQTAFACEVQMDIIAEKLGIDPLQIRLKNAFVEGDSYINGQILQNVGVTETLEKAAGGIDWGKPRSKGSGTKARGRGIATIIKGTKTPTESKCVIKMDSDASVTVISSVVEVGAGQKTIMAQIAADAIGVPLEFISIPNADTQHTPYDFGQTSSRTTYHMGNAICAAGLELRKRILHIAGDILKTDPSKLSVSDGKIIEESKGERMALQEVLAKKFGGPGGAIVAEGSYCPSDSHMLNASPGLKSMSSIFWTFATQAVEVEVDTGTGVVKVLEVAAAHDVGRAINPMSCEQQIEGSVVMGVSNALFEEFRLDKGRVMNDTLADYKIATIMDLPKTTPILVESYHAEGPFGAKGVGEPAAAPIGPAISNAIFDALGIRIKELPITPEKVLEALRKKKKE